MQATYKLSLLSCLGIVIGAVIGSGIFVVPALMIKLLPSPSLIMMVWVLSAVVSITGGLVIAGMGSAFPQAKDLLDYYRVLFPPWVAYAYNLASNWIINPFGSVAIAFMFAEYLGYFIPMDALAMKLAAILLLLSLTIMGSVNTAITDRFQVLFTSIKVIAILLLILLLIVPGKGSMENFRTSASMRDWDILMISGAFIAACTGALNAFDGWYMVGHLTAEVKGGAKTVSRSIVIGLLICMGLYLLTTFAYHYVLTPTEMASSPRVAVTALEKVSGTHAASLIAIMVLISTASGVNGNLVAASRLMASAATQKMLPAYFGVTSRKNIPVRAFWLIFFFEALLVWIGSFEVVLNMTLFAVWLFVTLLTAGFLRIYLLQKMKLPGIRKIPMVLACILLIGFGLLYLINFFR